MHKRNLLFLGITVACVALAQSDSSMDVIVRFKPSPDNIGHKRLMARGAKHKLNLSIVGSSLYSIKSEDLELLAADAEIEMIVPDRKLEATDFSGTPDYGWMTALRTTDTTIRLSRDGTALARP